MDITSEIDGAAERGVTVELEHDYFVENPRREDDYLRSRLWFYKPAGGESDKTAGEEFDFGWDDFRDFDGLVRAMRKAAPGVEILPVYKYEHSGVAYNTTGFSCPWDSGLAGLIYITAPAMRETFGVKRLTNDKRVEMRARLRREVETYGAWANGETYYVAIKDADGETIDSCGGFIGREDAIQSTEQMVACYALTDAA